MSNDNASFGCEVKGHWFYTYHTPKQLVGLYQASLNTRGKNAKKNFVNHDWKDEPKTSLANYYNLKKVDDIGG